MLVETRTSAPPRFRRGARLMRVLAWAGLIGVTGFLVHAEVQRAEVPDGVEASTRHRVPSGGRPRGEAGRVRADRRGSRGGASGDPGDPRRGMAGGSKTDFGRMAARLARHDYVVVSVEYLLSKPGSPSWPANFEDVREAVRWVRRHADEYGIDPDRIVAMGASAGGHLSALLGTYPDGPVAVAGLPLPRAGTARDDRRRSRRGCRR